MSVRIVTSFTMVRCPGVKKKRDAMKKFKNVPGYFFSAQSFSSSW